MTIEQAKNYFKDKLECLNNCWINKTFEDSELYGYFELGGIQPILGADDGCDTDIFSCVITSKDDNNQCWCKFYVEVDTITRKVLCIDNTCVDIGCENGDFEDCLDLCLL